MGLPKCIYVDIANPTKKLALEVDGGSHGLLKTQEADRRKEAFLCGQGWRVLRFSNQAATENTAACVLEAMSTISK